MNKKIIEYIGEEELTLTDFICSKVNVLSLHSDGHQFDMFFIIRGFSGFISLGYCSKFTETYSRGCINGE